MDGIIPSLVLDEENNSLSTAPSVEDMKYIVFSMDPASAPIPNGFNGLFYQLAWSIIDEEISTAVQFFFPVRHDCTRFEI